MDDTGAVMGVVVGKLNAQKISYAMGDIPQNVNFAIRGKVAKTMLTGNNIPIFFAEDPKPVDGPILAEEAQKFTVAIECYGG